MSEKNILCECYVDRTIIHFLGYANINKLHSISKVTDTLKYEYENIEKAIGLVDDDSEKAVRREVVNKGFIIEQFDYNLALATHAEREGHQLILLQPAAERWLLAYSERCGMSHVQFGLPEKFQDVKQLVNRKMMFKSVPGLGLWYNALKEADPEPFRQIALWLGKVVPPPEYHDPFGIRPLL